MVFRVEEGEANGIDLSGTVVVYAGDLPHSTYAEVVRNGSEGGIYVGCNPSPERLKVLDTLVTRTLGGVLMKKNVVVKYVDIEVDESGDGVHVKMTLRRGGTVSHQGAARRRSAHREPDLAVSE